MPHLLLALPFLIDGENDLPSPDDLLTGILDGLPDAWVEPGSDPYTPSDPWWIDTDGTFGAVMLEDLAPLVRALAAAVLASDAMPAGGTAPSLTPAARALVVALSGHLLPPAPDGTTVVLACRECRLACSAGPVPVPVTSGLPAGTIERFPEADVFLGGQCAVCSATVAGNTFEVAFRPEARR